MMTRRELPLLLALPAAQAAQPSQQSDLSIDPLVRDLRLSSAELRQAALAGERALREALWLAELPLDGIDPGFVFVPKNA